MAKITN